MTFFRFARTVWLNLDTPIAYEDRLTLEGFKTAADAMGWPLEHEFRRKAMLLRAERERLDAEERMANDW